MRSPLTRPALFIRDLDLRLNVARSSERGNCASTAFYLAGLIDSHEVGIDVFADAEIIRSLLDRCDFSDVSLPGCLVAWHYYNDPQNKIAYIGLVTTMAPLLITHRPGFYLPLEESVLLKAIDNRCVGYQTCVKRFYAPPQRT